MLKKLKNNYQNYFSRKFVPVGIVTLLLIMFIVTAVVFNMRKSIEISIDGDSKTVITLKSSVSDVLDAQKIVLGPKDKIYPNLDSKLEDGDNIQIKRAVNIELEVDGKNLSIKSAENNIKDMLSVEGITLNEMDVIKPELQQVLEDGLKIKITRVKTEIVEETKDLDFKTVVKKDSNMEEGKQKVLQEGEKGQKVIKTKVVYEDGKEVLRTVVSEAITKQPINKILCMGTLGAFQPSRGQDIGLNKYTKVITVTATAYTASSSARTATGTKPRRNPDGWSTISVDPRVIPLGTKVYVEGYGYAIAEDVGGAVNGNIIDVFLSSRSSCINWGRKRGLKVYILK